MNWNELAKDVHQVAVANGLWDKPLSFAEFIVDCHADLSKAAEAYRAGWPMVCCDVIKTNAACTKESCGGLECLEQFPVREPEGVAVHLADCVLRILDYLAAEEFDINEGIGSTPAFTDTIRTIAVCHKQLSKAYVKTTALDGTQDGVYINLLLCIETILDWASQDDLDMESILQAKHAYNKSRIRPAGGDEPRGVTKKGGGGK